MTTVPVEASEEEVQRRIDATAGLADALASRGTDREDETAFLCAWANRRLVVQVVRRVRQHRNRISHTFEDLVQEGVIGVARAVATYDPRVASFSTYCVRWVVQAVVRAIDATGQLVRRPHWLAQVSRDLERGRYVAPHHRAYAEQRWATNLSLDARLGEAAYDEVPSTLLDVFLTEQVGADEELEAAEVRDLVARAVSSLHGRERVVVEMRFRGEASLREVGAALVPAVTRQRVEQLERVALAKLRRWFERNAPWLSE